VGCIISLNSTSICHHHTQHRTSRTRHCCGWLFGYVVHDIIAPLKSGYCAIGWLLEFCFPPPSHSFPAWSIQRAFSHQTPHPCDMSSRPRTSTGSSSGPSTIEGFTMVTSFHSGNISLFSSILDFSLTDISSPLPSVCGTSQTPLPVTIKTVEPSPKFPYSPPFYDAHGL
jgi:hypothetical protein